MTEKTPRPYQTEFINSVMDAFRYEHRVMGVLPTGCHRAGQGILMFDGTIKEVQDIKVGDRLMGMDSTPRTVLSLHRGRGKMVEIVPVKGNPWVVNEDHVLTLVQTNTDSKPKYPSDNHGGRIVDVTVRDYLKWSKNRKHRHKLFRVAVDFPLRWDTHPEWAHTVPFLVIDPYFMGVVIGDGSTILNCSVTTADDEIVACVHDQAERRGLGVRVDRAGGKSNTYHLHAGHSRGKRGSNSIICALRYLGAFGLKCGNKKIPFPYLVSPREDRLRILAGLIDTDGSLPHVGCYDFVSKSSELAANVAFIARSLGFAANLKPCVKRAQTGPPGQYYRVLISGDVSVLPVRIPRKKSPPRRQKKSVLRTGFTVRQLDGEEDYYGFTIDGDHRYLLNDFTVTHNCGKTVCFTKIAKQWNSGRVMIVAHRDELISQAAEKLHAETGEFPSIEQASLFSNESNIWGRSQYVVASVQSLHERRLTADRFNDIGLLVIDECHHASGKNATYGRIVSELQRRNPNLRVLGVTATPDRKDGEKLMFDRYAYKYSLKAAIDDGWLAPIKNRLVVVKGLDFSKVRKLKGELDQKQIADALEQEAPMQEIATVTVDAAGDKSTVVFCASVAQAEATCGIINRLRPGKAKWICGDQNLFPKPLRREILKQFDNGEIQYIVGMGVLLEGWDCDRVELISWARPTASNTVYVQGIGRGMRLLKGVVDSPEIVTVEDRRAAIAASAKPRVEVIDFVDQSRRSDLVTACDPGVLGGYFSEAEVAEAKKAIEEKAAQGRAADVEEELEAARKRLEEEEERKRRQQEERKHLVADVNYELVEHDVFDPYDKGGGMKIAAPTGKLVTEKQALLLEKYGINPNAVNRKQAQGIINQIRQGKFKPKRRPNVPASNRKSASVDDVNRLLWEAARG